MSTTDGLEDIVATQSRICDLDGKLGKLTYFGVDIHDLARYSTFEETAYLLWHGVLPTRTQLEEVSALLQANRELPGRVIEIMHLLPRTTPAMDVLRTIVSTLSSFDPNPDDKSAEANYRRAIRLTAVLGTIVTTWEHIRNGRKPVAPLRDHNTATNFLYMLKGEMPDEYTAHVFDVALVLHADHELNASTFAARVTAGTLADMYASITSAIGALSGPLHGGANEQVMRMLLRIGEVSNAEPYIRDAVERKERIMGFGHRVYKIKEHKGLYCNVDFYSASVYYMMGIPIDLDTPVFARSRIAGYTAHVLEQYSNNRLIRPRAEYVGPKVTQYIPIEQRG